MEKLNEFLGKLAIPVAVDKSLKKATPGIGVLALFIPALAEFKYTLITSFPDLDKGWNAYKQCASLMASHALTTESSSLDSSIERMLSSKVEIRKRYLDWLKIIDDPEKFATTKEAYINALISLGTYSKEDCEALIRDMPPLKVLSHLDKRLNEDLNSH